MGVSHNKDSTMEHLTPAIITAVLTPVAAAVVGYFATRVGLAKKTREAEYWIKRLEVIQNIEKMESKLECNKKLKEILVEEKASVLNYLATTSKNREEISIYDFDKKNVFIRLVTLPKPRTFGGWAGAVLFYIYFFYAFVLPLVMFSEFGEEPYLYIFMPMALLFAYFCRYTSICSSKMVFLQEQITNKSNNMNADRISS